MRNLARFRRFNDGGGGGAEIFAIHLASQRLVGGGQIVGLVVDGGKQQFASLCQRQAGAFAVEIADDELVNTGGAGFAGASETVRQAGQAHQFQYHVLQDVPGPGAFLQPAQEAAAFIVIAAVLDQAGQPGGKALVQTGNLVGGQGFQVADVDPGFQAGRVGPDAGATQGKLLDDANVVGGHVRAGWGKEGSEEAVEQLAAAAVKLAEVADQVFDAVLVGNEQAGG